MNAMVIEALAEQHIDELRQDASRRRLARAAAAVSRRRGARRNRRQRLGNAQQPASS